MRTAYAALWIAWVVAFMGIEFTAMATGHTEYTLSDFVWQLERLGAPWTALRYFIAAACVWLFFHISLGWFR